MLGGGRGGGDFNGTALLIEGVTVVGACWEGWSSFGKYVTWLFVEEDAECGEA